MDPSPQDVAARRDRLERWVDEQQRRMDRAEDPLRTRLGRAVAKRGAPVMRAVTMGRRVGRASQWFGNRVLNRGLDTSFSREPEHDERPDRLPYQSSPWHTLPRALRHTGVSERDTFIDFGCGKGQVVHQAARRPFRRVIGVEISPALAEIARTNLAARRHRHRCRNVEIVVSDVTEYSVPDDLTIGYLFHPVANETFDALLRNIVDSIDRRPRRVRLIYVSPLQGSLVLATGRFRLLKEHQSRIFDTPSSHTEIYENC